MVPFKYDTGVFKTPVYAALDAAEYSIPWNRLLPSFALDISNNEGCGWTHPELHSYLIDGITSGGHTVRDEDIVRNIKTCWEGVSFTETPTECLSERYIRVLHSILMRNLLHERDIGVFRRSTVRISGADDWVCIAPEQLSTVFEKELPAIRALISPVEQAVIAQLWVSYRQFFADGNKRVARMLTNAILSSSKTGIFAVPNKAHSEFTKLLCEFYNTADATELCAFIVKYCLHTFDENGRYCPPAIYRTGQETVKNLILE